MKPNSDIEVVIAEDSRTQAEQLRFLLEERGYRVTATANGKEALVAARAQKPALIISDILMPEMDGYELCKAIKSDARLQDIPVILVTTLSDAQDVMRGLESGADNFIRKPYDGAYLLARIDYLLMNLELRKNQKMHLGVEINLGGHKHFITAERQQILDLLISTYEQAVHINSELKQREEELAHSNRVLNGLYRIAEGLNQAISEQQVAETALERVLELPGIQAGWISLREGESGFRLAATRKLPPALSAPGAFNGDCACRRMLVSGEIASASNLLDCERLAKATGAAHDLHSHAVVPLWLGERTLGMMNLMGPEHGLFDDDALKMLHGIGNQVAVTLERARLHEHLEQLVAERTAKLAAEVEERKRIQEEQARLVAIIEATPDLVGTAAPDGHLLYANQAGQQMLGVTNAELSSLRLQDVYPEWASKLVAEEGLPHALTHGSWSGETALRGPGGRELPALQVIIAHKGHDGAVAYLSTIARDISQRKAHEAKIVRLNRAYSVISGINSTIVRVHDAQELFTEACRIAVDIGRFRFAWIGRLDPETQQVVTVAQAGCDDGYLSPINLSVAKDSPANYPLLAQALSEAKPMICNDIAADARVAHWRGQALKRGYRSLAMFPLILEGRPVGVFALYAPEPGIFDDEEMAVLVEMAGDISFALDHLKKEERLNYLAYFDALTGLPNSTLFQDRLEQRINAARLAREEFSVLILDLERFSRINETFGRQAGDKLLRQFAQRLQETLDEADILARLTGDNFGIAIPHGDHELTIAHVIEKILSGILTQPFDIAEQELRLSARAGVSSYPADGEDIEKLVRNAEAALKNAKLSGNKYLFYTPEFNARIAEKLALENNLRKALEQGQLLLHYQPKVNLKSGQICGLEALMRWNDPERGLVPPAKFIPVFEETGMIIEAGAWALQQAVSDYRQWRDHGLHSPRIAVNVSQVQLQRDDFVSSIERIVSGAGDVIGGLAIEITESMLMQNIETNIEKLQVIQGMGVEVAIDDFGTGYSSLSYIAKLPINSLKIDRAFIKNMASNPDDLSIVSTIISLAHALNLCVIAEGVETPEQAKLLRLLKCDEIQGFLFSPGVPAGQVETLLGEKKSL